MWPFSTGSSGDGKRKAEAPAAVAPHPLPPGVTSGDTCPVDESTRQAWLDTQRQKEPQPPQLVIAALPGKVGETSAAGGRRAAVEAQRAAALSKSREVSSIPRAGDSGYNGGEGDGAAPKSTPPVPSSSAAADASGSSEGIAAQAQAQGSNWVYPSPAQFYSAMARKNHNPSADDMPIVVSIHNAVNERAWQEIIAWERGWLGSGVGEEGQRRRKEPAEECGGLKLVSFTGKPHQLTWRAWGRTLLGYSAPFDRHDWIVDRCGNQVRYIIDFYTGRPIVAARTSPTGGPVQNLAFYLDVRPAPDTVQGWAMRFHRTWLRFTGDAPKPGAS
ncbi:unnamed protein product [Tilletia laevis]|uniref:Holocytochrome c-type synthase n=2 Tax=Tilletia TaxID=13289 RepID=A0A177V9Y9_9BASI|nr:hypothetical protein CF336_g3943 [Tilletia laevis]KAE8261690.1 hypothetical protein A4X03_0g3046 [Tilletia caries]KAE8203842.1 hypothetical protein CF335_g2878 [Tilletia laevis]CAD6887296.1 unnamed protein product [Tilletia caries]CAD6901793.1 unnamed protein product [Tilletia caries]